MKHTKFFTAIGALLLILGILPLMLNAGTIPLILGGIALLTSGRWPQKWRKLLLPLISLFLAFSLIYMCVILYFGYFRTMPEDLVDETVVVLGCKVNGDQPSLMLKRRLDTAVNYLNSNPDAVCIVSGGQGSNETRSEASVMQDYLLAHGIAAERIYVEDQSTDTRENLTFSKAIIEEQDLNPELVIISDGFHQFRAWLIANKLDMTSHSYSAHTSWWLVPAYSVREVLSLIKLLPFLLF